jgi:CheY-like chemotaxis protein
MSTSTNGGAGEASQGGSGDRRGEPRLSYERSRIAVAVMHPGGTLSKFDVTCRDLSAGGLAFLHRGFLHAGTECQIRLPLLTGGEMTVHGQIVQCAHVQKSIHEVGVVFDEAIDPRQFLDVGAEYADLNEAPLDLPKLQGRLLHVSSDPLAFALFEHQLRGTGIEARSCAHPQQAANQSRQTVFDAIFCDLPFTDVTGEAVAASLRREGYASPIIAATAERQRTRLQQLKSAGVNEVLLKPFNPTTLVCLLSQHLQDGILLSSSSGPILSTIPENSSMAHLVADFIESAKSAAASLKKAEDAGDLHAVRVVCLQLQGHGSSFGFKMLTELAAAAVQALQSATSVADVGRNLEQLQSVCERLQAKKAA